MSFEDHDYVSVKRAQARAAALVASGHYLVIPVEGGRFISHGWRACVCGKRVDDWSIKLQPFYVKQDGITRSGWRCI